MADEHFQERDWSRIPTLDLPVIISSDGLNIYLRERALEEFASRLNREEQNFMDFMTAIVQIKECSMFKARARSLMDLLEERMRKAEIKRKIEAGS